MEDIVVLRKSELIALIQEEIKFALEFNNPISDKKELMDVNETKNFLKIHQSTLFRWKSSGILPFKQLGKRIYFEKSKIIEAMKNFDPEKYKYLKNLSY